MFNTDATAQNKYILANALQINAAFSTVRKKIEKQSFKLFYKPYEPLKPSVQDAYLKDITSLMQHSKSDECVNYILL